jgi:hypothetical protein
VVVAFLLATPFTALAKIKISVPAAQNPQSGGVLRVLCCLERQNIFDPPKHFASQKCKLMLMHLREYMKKRRIHPLISCSFHFSAAHEIQNL